MSSELANDVEAALLSAELRGWLLATGKSLWPGNCRISAEDLAQEGWVAMWRAAKAYDPERGSLIGLLKQAARRRMVDVLRQERYYVKAGRNGSGLEIPVPTKDDGDSESDAAVTLWDELAISDNIDALITAYHEGEIWQAVNELPERQRQYVLIRFYQGYTHTETMALMQSNAQGIWSKARVRLKERLEHLALV